MKHCSAVFRWLYRVFVFFVVLANLKLYCPSPLARTPDSIRQSWRDQLRASQVALESQAPAQMQLLFPEGYFFCYLFTGLTHIDVGLRDPNYADEAVQRAQWCLKHLESAAGKQPFPPHLPPDHGMFYSAWKAHLRAGVVMLQAGKDTADAAIFRQECEALATALEKSETPFLPSYRQSAWPCDTVPAIHALATHDHVFAEQRYRETIQNWLKATRQRLDPETGLLPHTASVPTGEEVSVARATSQMIILRLLPDIDAIFAKQQYELFRERYGTTFLGIPCVREYPSGVRGFGDIDSGPLIFGRSLSATVLMIGVAQVYGDQALADAIAQTGEVVGLPWTWNHQKRYAGGLLPVGDMMVGYAYTARPWFSEQTYQPSREAKPYTLWRWPIHALSFLLFVPPMLLYWRQRRLRAKPPADAADPHRSV